MHSIFMIIRLSSGDSQHRPIYLMIMQTMNDLNPIASRLSQRNKMKSQLKLNVGNMIEKPDALEKVTIICFKSGSVVSAVYGVNVKLR